MEFLDTTYLCSMSAGIITIPIVVQPHRLGTYTRSNRNTHKRLQWFSSSGFYYNQVKQVKQARTHQPARNALKHSLTDTDG